MSKINNDTTETTASNDTIIEAKNRNDKDIKKAPASSKEQNIIEKNKVSCDSFAWQLVIDSYANETKEVSSL